jgi:hypothetical protein
MKPSKVDFKIPLIFILMICFGKKLRAHLVHIIDPYNSLHREIILMGITHKGIIIPLKNEKNNYS